VHVDKKILAYITQIVHATREHEDLSLGGSPRASISLFRASQAVAAIRGRNYVEPDDVKNILAPVLLHRLILRPESRLRNIQVSEILVEIMDEIPGRNPSASVGSANCDGSGIVLVRQHFFRRKTGNDERHQLL